MLLEYCWLMNFLDLIRSLSTAANTQGKQPAYTQDQLNKLSFSDIRGLRDQPGADQNLLGPAEHRAYAKDTVMQSPVLGTAQMALAIPAYTAAKAVGLQSARSDASFKEMGQGYAGIWDGIKELMAR